MHEDTELACDVSPWTAAGFVNALTDVRAAGFAGIEGDIDLVPAFEDRVHVLKEMLDAEGLTLVTIRTALRTLSVGSAEEEGERCLNVARFLHGMGCKLLVIVPPPVAPESAEEEWLLFTNLLSEAGRRAGEFGVRVLVAPAQGSIVGTRAELEHLAKAFPAKNLPLAVDAGFLFGAGLPVAGFFKKYKARLAHLYLSNMILKSAKPAAAGKQAKGKKGKAQKAPAPKLVAVKGGVNVSRFLDAATAARYQGWVTVRLKPSDVHRDAAGAAERAYRVAAEALDLI
jgi:sugar phosphate isomerase/epimerase